MDVEFTCEPIHRLEGLCHKPLRVGDFFFNLQVVVLGLVLCPAQPRDPLAAPRKVLVADGPCGARQYPMRISAGIGREIEGIWPQVRRASATANGWLEPSNNREAKSK
jgi:hypothetical protein